MNLALFSVIKAEAAKYYFRHWQDGASHAQAADFAVRKFRPDLADEAKDHALPGTLKYWEYVRTHS